MATPEVILSKVLTEIANENKLNYYKIAIKPCSSGGANFLSVIYKGTISSTSHKDIAVFAKIAALPEALRTQLPIKLIYESEISVYTRLVPAFAEFEDKYEIPRQERYTFPKYYSSNLNEYEENVVLEDLTAHGYTMYDRLEPISWEYASKVVESLARFHALSLALKRERPEVYSVFDKSDMTSFMYDSMKGPSMMMAGSALAVAPEHLKGRLTKFIDNYWSKENFVKIYGPSKWGFLTHGDFRPSNIMFRYQDSSVTSVVPVDYQSVHSSSPCTDLLYFLYCGADEEFRRSYLQKTKDHYYSTLSSSLMQLKFSPEETFSRDDFEDDFKQSIGLGLCTAMTLLPTVLAEGDDVPNLENSGLEAFAAVKPNEAFRKRFLPILEEYAKAGIL